MAKRRFDRERFAYELAQELGVDHARVPTARAPGEAVRAVQDDIQSTLEVGPAARGTRAARAGADAAADAAVDELDGAASGLSPMNRARATPVRSALDPSPTREAERDARDVLARGALGDGFERRERD